MTEWEPVTPVGPVGEPEPWYRSRGPLAAVIAVSVALLFLLIAFLIWLFSGDGDDAIAPDDPTTTVAVVTTTTTTTAPATVPPPAPTEPPVTEPPVTEPPVTEPPVTEPPVTEPPPTIPLPTQPPTTTTSVPVVTSPPGADATVWDIVDATPDLSRLRQLLIDAELDDVADGEQPLTLFAPGNDAFDEFEALPGGAELLADPALVATLLLRHMAFGETYTAAELLAFDEVLVATGEFLPVDGGAGTIDGAALIVIDVVGSNGVIHVVERVLAP